MRSSIFVFAALAACSSSTPAPEVSDTSVADSRVDGGGETIADGGSESSGPCPAGEVAEYGGPGCDVVPTCVVPGEVDACTAVVFFCGCDGETKTGTCGTLVQRFPYRSEGECAADAATD
jgi:hypothetical protein